MMWMLFGLVFVTVDTIVLCINNIVIYRLIDSIWGRRSE